MRLSHLFWPSLVSVESLTEEPTEGDEESGEGEATAGAEAAPCTTDGAERCVVAGEAGGGARPVKRQEKREKEEA